MTEPDEKHVGKIGYYELYHIEDDGIFRVFTNRDGFETEVDVPDGYDGNITDIYDEIYSKIVSRHNEWMMSQ